jgi:hypothetical protein
MVKKFVVEVLLNIHVFSSPEEDNFVSGKSSASVGPRLSPDRLDGFSSY